MIVSNKFAAFAASASEINTWCAAKFTNDPVMIAKCQGGPTFSPPWTAVGALIRGIPWHGVDAASVLSQPAAPPASQASVFTDPAAPSGVLGLSKGVLFGGLAILGVGAAVMLTKKGGR
jgi:hypothetical protein